MSQLLPQSLHLLFELFDEQVAGAQPLRRLPVVQFELRGSQLLLETAHFELQLDLRPVVLIRLATCLLKYGEVL